MDRRAGEAPFREGDAQAVFEDGERLAGQGDLERAGEAYRRADEAGHPTAAAYAGVFDEAHGDTASAQEAYRRADERGDGFGAFRLGLLLSLAGDWDGAREAWARAEERGHAEPPFDVGALAELQQEGKIRHIGVSNVSAEELDRAREIASVVSGTELDETARAHQATTAQVAIAWLLQHSPAMLPIPGTSSVGHFHELLEATQLELEPAQIETLDGLAG